MTGLGEDLRYACRTFVRGRRFTVTAAVTLALVIGTNTAIFSLCRGVLGDPIEVTDLDRLVLVDLPGRDPRALGVPPATFAAWKGASRSFAGLSGYDLSVALVSGTEGPSERLIGADVGPGFFPLLGGQVALGQTFPGQGPEAVVVLSHALWKRRFGGDPGVIGKTLLIGDGRYTITGVMAAGFAFPLQVDLWYPAQNGGEGALRVFGRLAPGVSMEDAQNELEAIHQGLQQAHPAMDQKARPRLEPLRNVDLTGARPVLETVLAGSYFLLLIGCANLATQLLAQALGRRKEIAARVSLGASRARILRQLLVECLLLSLAAAALGALVAHWLINGAKFLFSSLDFLPGFRNAGLSPVAFGYLALAALVTALLFGLVPSLHLARTGIHAVVKAPGSAYLGSGWSRRMRDALIVTQVSLAVVVAFGALTFGSLLQRVMRDKGFDARDIASANLQLSPGRYPALEQTAALSRRLLRSLRQVTAVRAAALVQPEPYAEEAHKQPVLIAGAPAAARRAYRRLATSDFATTLSIPLLRGRMLGEADDQQAPRVAVVSRSFASAYLPAGADALGRRISFDAAPAGEVQWCTIVGVIEDAEQTPGRGPEPTVYLSMDQWYWTSATVLARTAGGAPLSVDLRRVVQAAGPGVFVAHLSAFDHVVQDRLTGYRLLANLTALFGLMALLIAALGLNGATRFLVAARTNELGVRAAMGATPGRLLRFILGRSLALTAIGLALGVAATVPTARYTEQILYAFGAPDGRMMAGAALAVLLVAMVASLIPGLRASRLRPVAALRHE